MVSTSKVFADCLWTVNSGVVNWFYAWVEALDWIDTWHQYISRKFEFDDESKSVKMISVMTPSVRRQLQEDALIWWAPSGIFSRQRDIDPNSYYIARDNKWNPLLNDKWEVIFKYKWTWETVEWDKIPFKKINMTEEKWYKKPLLWLYDKMWVDWDYLRQDQKRMVAAPIWYPYVKNMLMEYVNFWRQYNPKLMTPKWWSALEDWIKWFFINIENGRWPTAWYKTIYELFDWAQWNHWYLMAKVMPAFDRILEDPEYMRDFLGYWYATKKEFRALQESAAAWAGKATWSEKWVLLDVIDSKYANEIYGSKWTLLYSIDDKWNVIEDPHYWTFNKNYFMHLSFNQQLKQLEDYFDSLWEDFKVNKVTSWIKINLCYNLFGRWLRLLKIFWEPALYAAAMTLSKTFEWFMPLLILNSWMYVTDLLTMKNAIKWDWKPFFTKWGLNDWLPVNVRWYSSEVPVTLWDIYRRWKKLLIDAYKQWLFNLPDLLVQNSYMVKKYEQFFLSVFPEVNNLVELDTALEMMKKNQPEKFVQLMEAAKTYAEYAVRMSTTNTPVAATLIRVHPVSDTSLFWRWRTYQPAKDTYYSLYHFFSWWWYNKTKWAWTILRDWMNNIMEWRIWAQYLDELLAWWDTAREAYAKMTRAYLENEDLLYLFNKVYTALMIWKYLDRLSETWEEKNSETLFKDIQDMFSYIDIFSWEYAWLFANPTGRIYKTFFENFIWDLEYDIDPVHAWVAGSMAVVKEYFRSLFRKLYFPKMTFAYASKINAHWWEEEKYYLKWLMEAIQDESTWFMFYLRDSVENWWFSYHIPKWANQSVRDMLWMWVSEIQYINEEQLLSKYANLFNWDYTFLNWILYSFPMFKQWNMNQLVDVNEFVNDLTKVRWSKEYNSFINLRMPDDATYNDYLHMYNVVTWRLNWWLNNLNSKDLSVDFTFIDEKTWELKYNKKRQIQEDLLYTLMKWWLSKEDAQKFSDQLSASNITKQKAHALETLAYIEANQPGSSFQAVAYLMNAAWFDYVKDKNWFDEDIDEIQKNRIMQDARVYAAKKYQDYIWIVDKNVSWSQIMMHYFKDHNSDIAKYISDVWEWHNKTLKFITPWDDKDADKDTNKIIYQNKILRQNFQAQLFTDILWAKWDINARMVMNWYALIFETNSYTKEDGSLDPDYAAFTLNQLESVWDHFNSMPMDEDRRMALKEWTLQFADNLLPWVLKDERLMQREDVKNVTQDWISFLYWEAKDLNNAARERAEDDIANKSWNKWRKKYKSFYTWWALRYPTNKIQWHNYLTGRLKSLYSNYRVYDWTPRTWTPNYLSNAEFEAAKRAQEQFMYWGRQSDSSQKKSSGKSKDDWIWVSTKRGKALQFYKREDPDKPVEYKLPWRKRRVRRWSGAKPISTTTWKHLTPTPKR